MVFTTTNLFEGIACPGLQASGRCNLTHCIFSHEEQDTLSQPLKLHVPPFTTPLPSSARDSLASLPDEPLLKKRKIVSDDTASQPPGEAKSLQHNIATKSGPSVVESSPNIATRPSISKVNNDLDRKKPATFNKPVSPPPLPRISSFTTTASADTKAQVSSTNPIGASSARTAHNVVAKQETLNPRLLANDPVGHARRTMYLKHLHGAIVSLNQQAVRDAESKDRDGMKVAQSLVLSDNELIRLALDEEEKTAKEQGPVYANVIKNRIASYKKMDVKDWLKQRKASATPVNQAPQNTGGLVEKQITTGLDPEEEYMVLKMLVVKDQALLSSYGYIPSPPSEVDAKKAALAVEASWNYEVCERCTARFQVFPSRNEEGLLTGQGKCRYHPRRKINPQRTKADTGVKEPFHPCCNEPTGSTGCTESDHHVFKASSPARLAAVLPFIITPDNPAPAQDRNGITVNAVAFDCEMGYTTLGLELIRLTALSWPQGETLVDVLVRPLGIVLDLNSQFSGVFPENFLHATPYSTWVKSAKLPSHKPAASLVKSAVQSLPVVENPQAARVLLCSFLTPQTPLIGHAIENDLNAVRLCHPSIVDTILLFPHRRGLPMRMGLRVLTELHLGRHIQQSSKHGHDSSEDAQATADLVRVAIRQHWKKLSANGWKFAGGELIPPSPSSQYAISSTSTSLETGQGRKKRNRADVSTDDEVSGREEGILMK